MSIFELNKIMGSMTGTGKARRAVAEALYNSTHYSEQMSDFGDVLESARCFGLLDMDGDNMSITGRGAAFVGMARVLDGKKMLNGTEGQREFLRRCLDGSLMRKKCGSTFKKFHVNYSADPPVWNSDARKFDQFELCLLTTFREIGIISRDRNILTVGTGSTRMFSSLRNGLPAYADGLSERQQEVGNAGEILAMDHEMKRLAGMGRDDLSDMVKQVSLVDPYVGYDIASFDGDGSKGSHHDRLIEVKSTTGTRPRFFWSRNEVRVAKKHGDAYWIYLWTDVEGSATLHMIQNPYAELFNTGDPKPEPSAYVVDKGVLDHSRMTRNCK